MKAIRIFLLILIIIGIGLLFTQKSWVPNFVDWILKSENDVSITLDSKISDTNAGWKVYTDSEDSYQVSYLGDWKVDRIIESGQFGYDKLLFCPPDEVSGCKENSTDAHMSDQIAPISITQFDADTYGTDVSTGVFTDPLGKYVYVFQYTDFRSETKSVPDYTAIYKQMISSFQFQKF